MLKSCAYSGKKNLDEKKRVLRNYKQASEMSSKKLDERRENTQRKQSQESK